ncbi:hypothetical protein AMAG_11146 [Allomyces macrogynus ATCC 38327]|uniref:G-protein coupled receptors family 3 profile domain-containing protein n=1 Tax=Allomyces macrogynus (strain ATCC 38327) TaxID=578462 RepID=A0A0L0SSQ8_ALLM3|nr:hypothetical protein AMAG_11146 [Allomyces macrogynus ATCC 38327]|eukprot:KNE65531.1 hypothetical protein AMAG_11146 [Allomyces macrogynus ATCC 38327]
MPYMAKSRRPLRPMSPILRLGATTLLALILAIMLQPWSFVAAVPTNLTVLVLLPLSDPTAGAVFRSFADVMSVAPPAMNAIDPDHNYHLVVQDTGNVRSNAVTLLLNVTAQQPVHALVGEYSSRVTLGVALAANSRRLWHCGVASAIDFDNKQDFGSFFRIAPNDNQQGPVLAQFVASMSWRAVNILAVADPYGQSLSSTFSASADRLGISLYTLQQYAPGTTNFGVYLDTIRAGGSKIVMFYGFPADCKTILRQAKAKGMVGPDWVWVGTHTMYNYLDTLTMDSDRLLADGMLFSALREDHATPQYQALRSSFLAQFPSQSPSVLGGFALMYFDCFLALANGFKTMTSLHGEAAVQTHSYSATLPEFLSPFNGTTGSVAFADTGSRIVHEWQIMNIFNNSNRAAYALSGSGRVDKWIDMGVQVLAVIRALMILAMLGGMMFLATNRAEKQIRQLSLPFLLFISLGCVLILASDFILIGVPSSPACHASTVVFTFGYEMVFASAIVKTYRIWRIFDNTRISKGGLKSQVLFRNVAMVMAVQAILFIIWMAAFPVWPALVTTKTSLYYECRPTNFAGHWAIVGLSFAFNGVMLLLLSYLAYKTRNVDSSYRETSWILHAAQNVFLCSVVIVPLSLVTIESFALTAYFIRSVFMLYAVAFTFMALVGRLIVAVWIEHQIKTVTPTTLMSTTLASAADGQFHQRPKGSSADGESPMVPRRSATAGSPAQPTSTSGVPGSEMGGVYPALRRGGGLGFFERFTQTWRTTQVYLNVSRGLVAIAPPPPGVGVARSSGGSATLRKSVRKRSVAAPAGGANHDEPMGAAIPLTSLGFDASPGGAPPGCLEFVHLGSGAAWVVQMNGPEEVASWTHYLKAVASVITSTGSRTGQTSSSSNGTSSATGNVIASGRTLASQSPSPSPSPVRANSERIVRTAAG